MEDQEHLDWGVNSVVGVILEVMMVSVVSKGLPDLKSAALHSDRVGELVALVDF